MSGPTPLYESAPATGRRLLLVSYHFPPGTAVGALRWQKLAPFVAERGYGIDVITQSPALLPAHDDATLRGLPPGVRVFGAEPEPGWAERIDAAVDAVSALKRRGSAPAGKGPAAAATPARPREESIGPERIAWTAMERRSPSRAYTSWLLRARDRAWAAGAVTLAGRLSAGARYDAVISCGPPHQAHEAGRRIAARLGVPLIIDLRDPWSVRRRLPEAYASPLYFHFAARDERRVVRAAALIIANTDELRDAMRRQYPGARVITVMNGWDEEAVPRAAGTKRFLIAYAGSIYLDRDPRPLLAALAVVVRERSLTPADIGLELMGSVHGFGGATLEALARQEGVEAFVKVHPRRPRGEALQFMASASMLVSLPQDSPLAVPSKVFEYMPFPAWVLALAGAGTPTARLLSGTDADVVAPHDARGIAEALLRRYDAFAAGARPAPMAGGERYSRRQQAALLLDALPGGAAQP